MAVLMARRWWALGGLMLCMLVVGLDMTVLNVALPTLSAALRASNADLQWFSDAYTLVVAAALLPAGLLGDRYGRKRLLLLATALFGAASAVSAYASSPGELVAARAVMGLGAAFLMSLGIGVIPVLFPQRERAKALAAAMAAMAAGLPLGPILGGWLLQRFWWGSVFLINAPVAAVGLVVTGALLPESRAVDRPRIDLAGVLLSSAGLAGVVYGTIRASEQAWASASVVVSLAAGAALLAAFVLWERRRGEPLVDLALFRSRAFTWGSMLATVATFAPFGVLFIVPQYLQSVAGHDTLGVGLRLLPTTAGLIVGVRLGERLLRRVSPKVTVAAGFAVLATGLALGATTGVGSAYGFVAVWLALLGLGMGVAMPSAMDTALGAVPAEHSGVGAALIMALRQVGAAFGVAILGSLLSGAYRSRLDTAGLPGQAADGARDSVAIAVALAQRIGDPQLLASARQAFAHGMDVALMVCAGLTAVGILLALALLPGRQRPPEESPAGGDGQESTHELISP